MDDTAARNRIARLLETEAVVWLSTTRPDGLPHLVPVWFWWDGQSVLVFSKPEAVKVRSLRENPALMLALGDPDADFDVGLLEARATVLSERVPVPEPMFAKYADRMAAIGLDPSTFAETYRQAVRIAPTRFLPWHGRTEPASARPATALAAAA